MGQEKNPAIAVALSIIPGAGFLYLRELRWAAMWFGIFALGMVIFVVGVEMSTVEPQGFDPFAGLANILGGLIAILIAIPVALLLKVLEFFHVYTVATRRHGPTAPAPAPAPEGSGDAVQDEIAELRARLARLEGGPSPEA